MPGPFPHVATDRTEQRPGDDAAAKPAGPHRLNIDGVPEQVAAARAFIRQVLGSGHPGTDRVTLLTSELVTNSINHSNSRKKGGTITVTVSAATDRVRVEVADDGGETVPAVRRRGELAEGGRGLQLVDAYSLAWNCHHAAGRTITWFECPAQPLP
jgi:anti-sigma regulatory factor (Ser/Thr protein kinase)